MIIEYPLPCHLPVHRDRRFDCASFEHLRGGFSILFGLFYRLYRADNSFSIKPLCPIATTG
ncbi:MAG: hypothetical protein LBP74_01930 [Treponema sp.]|nr:hypothetical protein [Treponema sp.]